MHWVIQSNLDYDQGMKDLAAFLERADIPHSFHKVVPFVYEIEPDINPEGNVIVMGTYGMRHLAKRKGWVPGSFDLANVTYKEQVGHWGGFMLNADAVYCRFADVPEHLGEDELLFIRPVVDSKYFSGKLTTLHEFMPWHHSIVDLKEDDGNKVEPDTMVMLALPKEIQQEYRVWIVDGKVATASLYKRGGKPLFRPEVDDAVLEFAAERAYAWGPARAYVMDVAVTDSGLYIIETNTLNSAGLYAADVCKLVGAIEAMSFLDNGTSTK